MPALAAGAPLELFELLVPACVERRPAIPPKVDPTSKAVTQQGVAGGVDEPDAAAGEEAKGRTAVAAAILAGRADVLELVRGAGRKGGELRGSSGFAALGWAGLGWAGLFRGPLRVL